MCLFAGDLTACACTKKYVYTFFALVVLAKDGRTLDDFVSCITSLRSHKMNKSLLIL